MIDPPAENRAGECPVCLRKSALVVDHDHSTGQIRGWLCRPCNSGLGLLGDTADGLRRALTYLEVSKCMLVA